MPLDPINADVRIGHVHLKVADLERSLGFYCDVLGFELMQRMGDQAAFAAGLNNEVTANGLLKMLRVIADGKAFSEEACKEMLEIMLEQQYRSGIPAGLPKAARVAHKTGNISTVHHDAGIIFLEGRKPYALVVLTQFAAETGRGSISSISV